MAFSFRDVKMYGHENFYNKYCIEKIKTVMVNNSTNINKMNNLLLPQLTEHKQKRPTQSISWLGTGTIMWQG